jgi:hypothetical protein
MEGLSISALAEFVVEQLTKTGSPPNATFGAPTDDEQSQKPDPSQKEEVRLEDVEALSEEDVDALLGELLTKEREPEEVTRSA